MIARLLEAIADVQMWRIADKHLVILAPPDTLEQLMNEELINGKEDHRLCLSQPEWVGNKESRFNDILVIEDESLTQVVVKSLVSEHRAVVQQ